MPKKTLSVYADPYAALDHEGRPAHACPTDPEHTVGQRKWVGARLSDATKLRALDQDVAKAVQAGLHEHPQDTVFEFDTEAVELPATPYYRKRIQDGELVPADEKTARACNVAFSDPKARIEASKQAAIKRWQADNDGELPPFAESAPAPAKPTQAAPKAPAAPKE